MDELFGHDALRLKVQFPYHEWTVTSGTPPARSLPTSESRGALDETEPINALTIDVEDYFQVSAFEHDVRRDDWPAYQHRVTRNTHRMLELLAERQTKATFYILGWTAERFPQLVRDIHAGGHEVGCHSYWHRLIYGMQPDDFREDLRRARDLLEDLVGGPVTTFRAPSFSIVRRSLWALEILVEERFDTDSSIFPTRHDRYGMQEAIPRLHRIQTPSGPIFEFPLSVYRVGPWNIPVAGGGYFRLYPLWWTFGCLRRLNRAAEPFVFYLHPWEIDPDQPRIRAGTALSRFRHRINLASTEDKFRRLLAGFRFAPMRDVVRAIIQQPGEPLPESILDETQGESSLEAVRADPGGTARSGR